MAIDPTIPLRLNTQNQIDPMESFGRALSMRHMVQQDQARSLQMQKAQRELAEREAFVNAVRSGAPEEVILRDHPNQAPQYVKSHREAAKAQAERLAAEQKLEAERQAELSRNLYAIIGTPAEQRRGVYAPLRQRMIASGRFKAEELPEELPDDATLHVEAFRALAPDKQQELILKAAAEERAKEAAVRQQETHTATLPGVQADTRTKVVTAAVQDLAGITDQESYTRWYQRLTPELQREFPPMYSPAAVKIAMKRGLTPVQQATVEGGEATRAETARHNAEMERNAQKGLALRGAAGKGGGGKGGGGTGSGNETDLQWLIENPSEYAGLPPSVKAKVGPELHRMGFKSFGKPLSESAIKQISKAEEAIAIAREIEDLLDKDPKSTGIGGGLLGRLPWTESAKIGAKLKLVQQIIGKGLEGGVLHKDDIPRYQEMLPSLNDPSDLAKSKIKNMLTTLDRDLKNYKANQIRGGRSLDLSPGGKSGGGATSKKPLDGFWSKE